LTSSLRAGRLSPRVRTIRSDPSGCIRAPAHAGYLSAAGGRCAPARTPRAMYYVIISRKCPEMQRELATALQGRRDVRVMLDRRYGERRAELRRAVSEKRRSDRRQIPNLIPPD